MKLLKNIVIHTVSDEMRTSFVYDRFPIPSNANHPRNKQNLDFTDDGSSIINREEINSFIHPFSFFSLRFGSFVRLPDS